jgi:hypothetical protein
MTTTSTDESEIPAPMTEGQRRYVAASAMAPGAARDALEQGERERAELEKFYEAAGGREAYEASQAEQAASTDRGIRERDAAFAAQRVVVDKTRARMAKVDAPRRAELEVSFREAQSDPTVGLDALFTLFVTMLAQQEHCDRLAFTVDRVANQMAGIGSPREPAWVRPEWSTVVQEAITARTLAPASAAAGQLGTELSDAAETAAASVS